MSKIFPIILILLGGWLIWIADFTWHFYSFTGAVFILVGLYILFRTRKKSVIPAA